MLRNLSIFNRTILFFGGIGLIVLILGVFSIVQQSKLSNETEHLGHVLFQEVKIVAEMRNSFKDNALAVMDIALATTAQQLITGKESLDKADENFLIHLLIIEQLLETETTQQLAQKIKRLKEEYDREVLEQIQLYAMDEVDEANQLYAQKVLPVFTEIIDTLSLLIKHIDDLTNASISRTDEIGSFSKNSITATLIITLLITGGLAFVFSRSVVAPLGEAVASAEQIAQGDLTENIQVVGNDEAARLMRSLTKMQKELRSTIGQITDSSQQLAITSSELSAVTNDSSTIVQQQSEQLEQAATAVNELTAAIEEVATSANITSSNSQEVSARSQESQAMLGEAVEALQKLIAELGTTSDGISELEQEVEAIGQVIEVIRGVAEQTNLLALNAAIEAARAGESGRGFAVVADEVRGLAHRTRESTEQIESMIHSVQEKTQLAVNNMQSSNQWADSTLERSSGVVEKLASAVALVAEINEQNLNIASAAEQQSSVAREVDKNLVEIRDLSFQTSSGANQTNASSQELAQLAEQLNELVEHFRLS